MTCATCTHWRLKDARDMARHGFGLCAREKNTARYFGASHSCNSHAPATQEVVQSRRDYLEKK